jgi:NAD(P)H dehydrogenase (quinone)
MKVFIVHAHPEPKSFNGALTRRAIDTLTAAGHEVRVSDLYAMQFNPVSGRANFTTVADPDFYKQQIEEAYATEHGGFAPDIETEIEKLEWCDVLIFQFPLWWFGVPAVLKGWVDRVFAYKRTYARDFWYEKGAFAGKRALVSVTTGGSGSAIYEPTGLHGPIDRILFPIQHGMLFFTGFQVLPPFIAYGVAHVSPAEREEILNDWDERLRSLATTTPLVWAPMLADTDESFRDTLSRYIVHFDAPAESEIEADGAAFRRLREQGVLLEQHLTPDRRQGWLLLRARSEDSVRRHLEALSAFPSLRCEITPVTT